MLVDRQITKFIKDQQRWSQVLFEFYLEAACRLCCGECVDGVDGSREENRFTGEAGCVSKCRCNVGLNAYCHMILKEN